MITAKTAGKLVESYNLEFGYNEQHLIKKLKNRITKAATKGKTFILWSGYFAQNTIDFLCDLGYTVVETEINGDYSYEIKW